jgi:hypothetical protein
VNVNPEDYIAQPNDWCETEITYTGLGRAEFSNPKGWIKGQTKVVFDEIGHATVEMDISDFYCEESLNTKNSQYDDLQWLINGLRPHIEGDMVFHTRGIKLYNTCTHVEVTTETGTYKTFGKVHYDQALMNFDNDNKVYFFPSVSQYQILEEREAFYWALPLFNFVSDTLEHVRQPYMGRHFLDQHPLRVYMPSEVSNDLPTEKQQEALMHVNSWSCFVTFKYGDTFGFIERLLDYKERAEKLLSSQANFLVTSVMVGECGDNLTTDFEAIISWIPLGFLHMLSLASGSLVGTSRIEFRDKSGELVSRLHTSQWGAPYAKGHVAVDGFSQGGIAQLLSKAPKKLDANVRTAIQLIVKGAQLQYHLDDQLAFLFRAADTLTKEIRHKSITSSVEISQELTNHIQTILKDAGNNIRAIAKESDIDVEKKEVKRIASVVFGAMNKKSERPNEGRALLMLMSECGLNDALVITDTEKWIDLFNKYRNQVIHESYFELSTNLHTPKEFIPLTSHLRDILIRILLKKLNYTGSYRKSTEFIENISVDWVTPDTTVVQLGYE